jgi:transposase
MSASLLPHALWSLIQPLLAPQRPRPKGGRPRLPDRACLTGILFVLRSGIPWEMLPQELGCGSGMTCWRRLRDWQEAGTWQLVALCFARLAFSLRSNRLVASRSRQLLSAGGFWGAQTGPNPTDRAKLGSKRHLICDGRGIPLAIQLTGANRMIRNKPSLWLTPFHLCRGSGDDRVAVLIVC